MDGQQRLEVIQLKLREIGCRSISLTWAPGAELLSIDDRTIALADTLEAFLAGDCEQVIIETKE